LKHRRQMAGLGKRQRASPGDDTQEGGH
jgi:hypothetical protein